MTRHIVKLSWQDICGALKCTFTEFMAAATKLGLLGHYKQHHVRFWLVNEYEAIAEEVGRRQMAAASISHPAPIG